jgi:hypothetical protein
MPEGALHAWRVAHTIADLNNLIGFKIDVRNQLQASLETSCLEWATAQAELEAQRRRTEESLARFNALKDSIRMCEAVIDELQSVRGRVHSVFGQ